MLLDDLLRRGNVETRESPSHKDEVWVCCPFCGEEGLYNTDKALGINLQNGKGHCFRCGWRSSGVRDTAKALCRVFGIKYDLVALVRDEQRATRLALHTEELEEHPRRIKLPDGYESFSASKDELEVAARQYLKTRGVTKLQIMQHRIGYAAVGKMAFRVIFPVLGDDGGVYGYVGRDWTGNQEPKYLNSKGIKLLWGANVPAERIVVCEGIIDALRVEQILLEWLPNSVSGAQLGSSITKTQLAQLAKYKQIIVFGDWDVAGVKSSITLAKSISATLPAIDLRVTLPDCMNGEDPGSLPHKTVLNQVIAARRWTPKMEWRLRARALKKDKTL